MIRNKKISSRALTELVLGRVDTVNPTLNAVVELVSRDDPRVGDRVPLYACGDRTISVRMLLRESD